MLFHGRKRGKFSPIKAAILYYTLNCEHSVDPKEMVTQCSMSLRFYFFRFSFTFKGFCASSFCGIILSCHRSSYYFSKCCWEKINVPQNSRRVSWECKEGRRIKLKWVLVMKCWTCSPHRIYSFFWKLRWKKTKILFREVGISDHGECRPLFRFIHSLSFVTLFTCIFLGSSNKCNLHCWLWNIQHHLFGLVPPCAK